MSDTQYKIYEDSAMALARSIVLKSSVLARISNEYLKALGYMVDDNRPETWRYYKNLCGDYHESDVPMFVTSIDTLTEISFDKATLVNHPATAREYRYGSKYYRDLVANYPEQVSLINGIIKPVKMKTAIEAEEFTIIDFNPEHIEAQEDTLIVRLQEWIYSFTNRWNVPDYSFADDLYFASLYGILFAYMPSTVLKVRMSLAGTREAHSYHVWSYLGSFNELDKYRSNLTHRQSMYLYRNIRQIILNGGKYRTFDDLVENLLTKSGFPIYGYDIVHNLQDMPEKLTPEIEMRRYPITLQDVALKSETIHEVGEVLQREFNLAADNEVNYYSDLEDIIDRSKVSASDNHQTKILEAESNSYSDGLAFDYNTHLIQNWMYLAVKGYYGGRLAIFNPINGNDIQLTPKEALILYIYCVWFVSGTELTYIPEISVMNVLNDSNVDLKSLMYITQREHVTAEFIEELIEGRPELRPFNTVTEFGNYCSDLFQYILKTRHAYVSKINKWERAEGGIAGTSLFSDMKLNFGINETYEEWLLGMGLDLREMSLEEANAFISVILLKAVDLDGSEDFVNRQLSALIDITRQLTHYDLQYLKVKESVSIVSGGHESLRPGDTNVWFQGTTTTKRFNDLTISPKNELIGTPGYRNISNHNYEATSELKDNMVLYPSFAVKTKKAIVKNAIVIPATSISIRRPGEF